MKVWIGKKIKTCNGCKYAEWKKTKTGGLSLSGLGSCTYNYKVLPLPQSMYFVASPAIMLNTISRHLELTDHCAYYQRENRKIGKQENRKTGKQWADAKTQGIIQ